MIVRTSEEMAFSKETIDAINQSGFIFSRRSIFNRPDDYVVINHGVQTPVNFGSRVKSAFVINKPESMKLSIHKTLMYNHVKNNGIPVIPTESLNGKPIEAAIDSVGFPFIIKPDVGSKGKGIKAYTKLSDFIANGGIAELAESSHKNMIIQKYINKSSEYRFNFFNGEVVNVSRKILPEESEKYPGIFDGWLSLGDATKLHKRAHKLAKQIAGVFPDLPSIAVDLMRVDKDEEHVEYHFGEINTAYGLGPLTAQKLYDTVKEQYVNNKLSAFKVK